MTSNRLPILQNAADVAHRECQLHSKWAADHALAAGAALTEAKALCGHGEWGAWLAETGIPERTAQRYMLLHRAGCKSAIVADFGMVRAERISSLGLRLWPQEGAGIEASGGNLDGAAFYAVVWPEGDAKARYWARYLFPDSTLDFYVTRTCGLPVVLGVLHELVAECFDLYGTRRMTAEETALARQEVEGTT
ncbi:MAG: DUF3102 domain-containing protein [Marinibacterium profundimaris]